jgi:hypothetical protein
MRPVLLLCSLFLVPIVTLSASAQTRAGVMAGVGFGGTGKQLFSSVASVEYRSGAFAASLRGAVAAPLFSDGAYEVALLGGYAQGERLGRGWLVVGPSLFVYQDNTTCFVSDLLGSDDCEASSAHSFYPGLAAGLGGTALSLGQADLGVYVVGNLNARAPMLGVNFVIHHSINGDGR